MQKMGVSVIELRNVSSYCWAQNPLLVPETAKPRAITQIQRLFSSHSPGFEEALFTVLMLLTLHSLGQRR